MFEEIFRIIFDRRHIKDVRLWVLIVLLIANIGSFWLYDKLRVAKIEARQDRQGKRIKYIIKVGKFESKITALADESKEERSSP